MLPVVNAVIDKNLEIVRQPSYTWGLDLENGCFTGRIEGLDAIRQAIFLRLLLYGRLQEFLGISPPLIYVNIKNRIIDTLTADDRITGVYGFSFSKSAKALSVRFTVETIEGKTKEVFNI